LQYKEFIRIERIKKLLDIIAYGSLAIDIGVALVTLFSLSAYYKELNYIQFFLLVALTIEVIVTVVLFFALVLLYHYGRILDNLARFSRALTGKKRGKW
jgi:predicted cation transporter